MTDRQTVSTEDYQKLKAENETLIKVKEKLEARLFRSHLFIVLVSILLSISTIVESI